MKIKLTSAIVAFAAVGALTLSGCGSSDRGGDTAGGGESAAAGFEEGATIGVALPQKTSENWVLAENLFNDGLTEAGYKPIVQFANGGVSEQQNQIQAMIEQGAKVIVVGAIDGSQLGSQLKAAHDQGVKVIAYDRLLQNTDAVDVYEAFDNFHVGELQGQSLLEGLKDRKGEGPYNVELISGSPDDANSKPFFEGAMSVLKPKIDDGTLVVKSGQTSQQQTATQGWKAENAQNRMDTILSGSYKDEDIDGILSPNDTLARAALTSAKQAGKDVPVVTGQDSEVESVKSIMAGVQYSTIYKDTRKLVAATIDAVDSYQAGEDAEVNDTESYDNGVKVVPANLLEPVIVTKDNAEETYAGDPTLEDVFK
ncbi:MULTISPECIES: substrate-binding domain-containing protein [unclassified Isoptericola]|uniref:substrate-binding domain-containing protein n=1 Tax=unclassified Isoptericola TaxID=2623355 RepID=UPI00365911B8